MNKILLVAAAVLSLGACTVDNAPSNGSATYEGVQPSRSDVEREQEASDQANQLNSDRENTNDTN